LKKLGNDGELRENEEKNEKKQIIKDVWVLFDEINDEKRLEAQMFLGNPRDKTTNVGEYIAIYERTEWDLSEGTSLSRLFPTSSTLITIVFIINLPKKK